MTERIDHTGWANGFINDALVPFDPNEIELPHRDATVAENLAFAQVHATLALVEQQRIANLLAFNTLATRTDLPPLNSDERMIVERVATEIREALGLE